MRFLDIVDPRARVVELREEGFSIITSWANQPSVCWRIHNVELYTLTGNAKGINDGATTKSQVHAAGSQMVLAL
ncbi:hypothetical protein ABH945_003759 [Paraburkholderia sp. GAS333]|uniref:helix-turn-helix domain-containing protein n=1 Tax=Paraburkholderia sp. GAS333 TaxID=3156279 RepID=UPI003D1961BE